ncbi:MAG: InlB B-repeat-containing protein [Oscillospiraceae bacterium]|nr:InlB B-repeat-containing protein [Oscillospiraceae bacterium]
MLTLQSDAELRNNYCLTGGAINNKGTVNMTGGLITDNFANSGGGIYNSNSSEFNMSGTAKITLNTASHCGGVYNSGAEMTMSGIGGIPEISYNTSDVKEGGGVFNTENSKFTMNNGIIRNNFANGTVDGNGAGVANLENSSFVMNGGIIQDNTAKLSGGGVFSSGTDNEFAMHGGQIYKNIAGVSGGGVYVDDLQATKKVTIDGASQITENQAALNGGGIALGDGVHADIGGTTDISGNIADKDGGAIYTAYADLQNLKVESGVTFADNEASTMQMFNAKRDQALFSRQILTNSSSLPAPYEKAYNNYDISYDFGMFRVNFNSNGGSAVASQDVSTGDFAVLPKSPTRDCAAFAGWRTDDLKFYDFANTPVTENITLHAFWMPFDYGLSPQCKKMQTAFLSVISSVGEVESVLGTLLELIAQSARGSAACLSKTDSSAQFDMATQFMKSVMSIEDNLKVKLNKSIEFLTKSKLIP